MESPKVVQLGKSDLQVGRIGFGCMSLEDDLRQNDQLISYALEQGINLFDTADLYEHGANELRLGTVLKGKRHQAVIATKGGNSWKPDGSGWDWKPGKAYLLAAVEKSLSRLKTDYLDLYQLHGGTLDDPFDDIIEAFEGMVQQGKIRYYGISSIRPNVIRQYAENSGLVSVMMQYSLLDRRPEESCFPLLQDKGISVLARGSLAQGLLLGKPPKHYLGHDEKQVAKVAAVLKELAGEEVSPTALALQAALAVAPVAAAVVGIRTMEQLKSAIGVYALKKLEPAILDELRNVARMYTYEQHR